MNTLGILLLAILLIQQTANAQSTFRVMEWNVENLFDTRHDSLKNDYEFLPDAHRHWNYTRYKKKIDDIARVIAAVGEGEIPALVALCEVENDSVLNDLTRRSPLKALRYRYVVTHSPDPRGIDVALLYQRDRFRLLSSRAISIPPYAHHRRTRDILHVSGLLLTGDTLDLMVCHLPSRSGGAKESAHYRNFVAEKIRHEADSVLQTRYHPQLIILGDFNDHPHSPSIRKILEAVSPAGIPDTRKLYHLLARKQKGSVGGSYKYQGRWELLDHLIVSGALLRTDYTFHTSETKAHIFHPVFLLSEDHKYGGYEPLRTYKGMKYQGGYSDHLPLYVDFESQE